MNILITGACGYIGSHFVRLAKNIPGFNLFAIDDLSTGKKTSIPESIPLLIEPLENTKAVKAFIAENKIDVIFHFAGKIVVSESVVNPHKYYISNTMNTANLADIAAKNGVEYFIFSSTAAVYGQPKNGEKIKEDDEKNPVSPYGASKLMSERIIADIAKTCDMKYAILRYFNVAGASEDLSIGQETPNATHLFRAVCDTALGLRDSLDIYGNDYSTPDGTGIRDYIHVCDLVSAHYSVLKYIQREKKSEIFNIGYGRGVSVLEAKNAVEKVSGTKIRTEFKPRRPGDCACVISDNTKITSLTDWQPKYRDIKTIAGHAYAWEKKKLDRR